MFCPFLLLSNMIGYDQLTLLSALNLRCIFRIQNIVQVDDTRLMISFLIKINLFHHSKRPFYKLEFSLRKLFPYCAYTGNQIMLSLTETGDDSLRREMSLTRVVSSQPSWSMISLTVLVMVYELSLVEVKSCSPSRTRNSEARRP